MVDQHLQHSELFKIIQSFATTTSVLLRCNRPSINSTDAISRTLNPLTTAIAGADPEILHGRWLPIVNHTGAKGVAG